MGLLEDKDEIRELVHRYFLTVDFPDAEASVEFFTKDAVVELPGREPIRGYDELLAHALRRPGNGMHVATNFVIDLDGDDARVTSYATFFVSEAGTTQAAVVGRYDDEMRRVDGRWRIAHRVLNVKLPPPS